MTALGTLPATDRNRTNVRSVLLPLALRASRAALGLLGAVAPRAAGRRAARLFVTPPRFEAPARERALLEEATAFPVYWRARRLQAWAWEPLSARGDEGRIVSVESEAGARPLTALLVHGWAGRGAQLGAFVEPLRRAGLRVVAFDHPAHGASDGEETNMLEMASAIQAVAAACGRIAVLVAHSLGGASALLAISRGLDVGRVALVAPPAVGRAAVLRFADFLGLPARAIPHLEAEVERRVGASFREVEVPAQVGAIATPVLVVHDVEDDDVPHAEGAALARALPSGRLISTRGLGHRRILRDPASVARIVEFVLGA